jgi:hypothetical protein
MPLIPPHVAIERRHAEKDLLLVCHCEGIEENGKASEMADGWNESDVVIFPEIIRVYCRIGGTKGSLQETDDIWDRVDARRWAPS